MWPPPSSGFGAAIGSAGRSRRLKPGDSTCSAPSPRGSSRVRCGRSSPPGHVSSSTPGPFEGRGGGGSVLSPSSARADVPGLHRCSHGAGSGRRAGGRGRQTRRHGTLVCADRNRVPALRRGILDQSSRMPQPGPPLAQFVRGSFCADASPVRVVGSVARGAGGEPSPFVVVLARRVLIPGLARLMNPPPDLSLRADGMARRVVVRRVERVHPPSRKRVEAAARDAEPHTSGRAGTHPPVGQGGSAIAARRVVCLHEANADGPRRLEPPAPAAPGALGVADRGSSALPRTRGAAS